MSQETQCTADKPCTAVQLLTQRTTQIEDLVKDMKNRLPPWVTGIAALGGLIIGTLATLATK